MLKKNVLALTTTVLPCQHHDSVTLNETLHLWTALELQGGGRDRLSQKIGLGKGKGNHQKNQFVIKFSFLTHADCQKKVQLCGHVHKVYWFLFYTTDDDKLNTQTQIMTTRKLQEHRIVKYYMWLWNVDILFFLSKRIKIQLSRSFSFQVWKHYLCSNNL